VKLSRKLEYACRVLAQLGEAHEASRLARVDQLAELECVPANYLVQILNELRNAGLIISKRGKQGGYALARAPEKIPLRAIVEAVDGELLESGLTADGRSGGQVLRIWGAIADDFQRQLDGYTLDDFVVRGPDSEMYYI
jgi:Rrf2 family protein